METVINTLAAGFGMCLCVCVDNHKYSTNSKGPLLTFQGSNDR